MPREFTTGFAPLASGAPGADRAVPARKRAIPWRSKSAGKPLLLTRILECVAPSAESQRDSATKPRVARNELPWENARHIGDDPERVVADDNGNKPCRNPFGVVNHPSLSPG